MINESDLSNNCREILDHLPSGVYVTDVHRKIIYWNVTAEKITGHSPDNPYG